MQQTNLRPAITYARDIPYLYKRMGVDEEGNRLTQRVAGPPKVVRVTLNRDPKFTKRFGPEVKAMGGRYTYCRGRGHQERYVYVPLDNEVEANQLIKYMIRSFSNGRSVALRFGKHRVTVARFSHLPLSDALEKYKVELEKCVSTRILFREIPPPTEAEKSEQQKLMDKKQRVEQVVKGIKDLGCGSAYGTSGSCGHVTLTLDDAESLMKQAQLYQSIREMV